jgi:hypothetical protein
MMPVLHQLGMPEFNPILYQFRLLPGERASDNLAVTDSYQRLSVGIDRVHVRRSVIFKEMMPLKMAMMGTAALRAGALRGPRFARAPQGDG